MTTLAQTLSLNALNKIVAHFDMREVGSPYLKLTNAMSPYPHGSCRIFTSARLHKLVYIGIAAPPINMDSHMFFAFTAPDSAVPHFTLDSVLAGGHFAFHLDLIPRVDLGANLAYMNSNFVPLTSHFDQAKKIEGLTAAQLSPLQYALMSPWMLAYRATEAAYAQVAPHIDAYLDHWLGLVDKGVAAPAGVDAAALAARDQANRNAIFSYEVDKVWNQIERLNGKEQNAKLIEILRNQAIETV